MNHMIGLVVTIAAAVAALSGHPGLLYVAVAYAWVVSLIAVVAAPVALAIMIGSEGLKFAEQAARHGQHPIRRGAGVTAFVCLAGGLAFHGFLVTAVFYAGAFILTQCVISALAARIKGG